MGRQVEQSLTYQFLLAREFSKIHRLRGREAEYIVTEFAVGVGHHCTPDAPI